MAEMQENIVDVGDRRVMRMARAGVSRVERRMTGLDHEGLEL